jgi:hypothetical protein
VSRSRPVDFAAAGVMGALGWRVGTGLARLIGGGLLALLVVLTVRLRSIQAALMVEGLLIAGVIALLRWRRDVARALRQLLNPRSPSRLVTLPAGWTGTTRAAGVYLFRWPPEDWLPPHLQGTGRGGRLSYIGKAADLASRVEEHVRDRREFILPGYTVELRPVLDPEDRHALEVALIRQADQAGEPIVNVQLHRTRR